MLKILSNLKERRGIRTSKRINKSEKVEYKQTDEERVI